MSEPIARPVFFEGQVLAAADLEAAVEHGRGEAARDRRYLHTPGIATGLLLTGQERETAGASPKKYQEVTLGAGVAIDGTGRQVVLAVDTRLDETAFDEQRVQVNDANAWYPVFLRGRDERAPAPSLSPGSCATSGTSRVTEVAEISFGHPGQELDVDSGGTPLPADGPGDPNGSLILVGFVQWDKTLPRFKKVALEHDGVSPHYAGVLADEVVSRSGTLALRSSAGANKAALVLDEADGGELRFGSQNAAGLVTPVLTVTAKGDVIAAGSFSSGLASGTLVESGIVSDGLLVPLPAGVTEDQVASGQVKLHVHLTPRYQGLHPALPSTDFVLLPAECRAEGRRVLCRFRWLKLGLPAIPLGSIAVTGAAQTVNLPPVSMQAFTVIDFPGFCDYTVLAYAAPAAGAGS